MAYTKQNFVKNQVLEAEHLNHIEDGIAANEAAINEKQPKGNYLTAEEAEQTYQPKGNYLTEHQPIKTINGQSLVGTGNIEIEGELSGDTTASVVYVNAKTGSDANDGAENSPKKTFAAAINASGDDAVIVFEGDTTEAINIKTKATQKRLRIIGKGGTRNRILGGTKLDSFTQHATNVYYTSVSNSNLSQAKYLIYQHDVDDTTTTISAAEKHASQRGRAYRCQSKKLTQKTTLSALTSASDYAFYYDSANTRLYIKTSNSDFANHPIFLPTDVGGVYGNDGTCEVEFYNIETWYAPFIVNKCHGASVVDCAAKFALGTGGFRYDDALGIKFIRCEACATNNLDGYGDGINGHSYLDNNKGANANRHIYVSAEMIDCWCHDNADDGWSDHTGCKSIVRGGLYEYNIKGGVTPSGGTSCECYNVFSRKNYRGFYYISSSYTTKEPVGEFYAQNCVSKDNSIAGFDTLSNSSGLAVYCQLVDCKSINDPIGFQAGAYCTVNLLDCSTYNVITKTNCDSNGILSSVDTVKINDDSSGGNGNSGAEVTIDMGAWELGAIGDTVGNVSSTTRIRTVGSVDVSAYNAIVFTFDSTVYKVAPYYYAGEPVPGGDDQKNGTDSLNTPSYDTSGKLTFEKSSFPTTTHLRLVIARVDNAEMSVEEATAVTVVGTTK